MLKRDSVWLGALLGLIAPIFGMWLFKVYKIWDIHITRNRKVYDGGTGTQNPYCCT